ncbi:hypothetical protein [Eleftheria terrae]|uniref:hypothetical protein n=1 Tax=Eleftheria terrae TaxID=1597781 RepID=UPI00263B921B|nr:hypothetical protein [Eleftheria terrae]WKB52489.1 hypothetical protein N7L95_22260 [Eleftheria terrae]
MTAFVSMTPLLRRVLWADALASAGTGALLVLGASSLAQWLGLPATLLMLAGASLLPFAALVAWLASRQRLPRAGLWALVAYNAMWVLDSALLLVSGWVQPSLLGQAFVVLQAVVVGALAELQYLGLRRASPAVA